jgi:hypothetical protein
MFLVSYSRFPFSSNPNNLDLLAEKREEAVSTDVELGGRGHGHGHGTPSAGQTTSTPSEEEHGVASSIEQEPDSPPVNSTRPSAQA